MRKVLAILTLFVLFSEVQAQTTLDQTPPTVNSINRQSPPGSTTNATSVTFKVTFSEKVSGVDATDFTATVVSGTLSATVASVTAVSSSIYSVTVNSISGDGVLRLDLNASGTGITDLAGNAISGGYTTGQTYTIDITPPTVKSINRQSPPGSTTNATSVTFKVTFSESVNGVDATDFTTTVVSGTLSATVASVTAVSSSIYSVTVNSISGDGVLRLDLNASGTGITDLAGNAISGGYTTGQTYTIDITLPTVKTSNRESPAGSTTNATSVTFKVTFSESVNGVDAMDFTATVVSGTLSVTVASITAVSSSIYSVTVNSISGDGVLRLDLNASGTGITDLAGNAISGGYTAGQTYIIDQTPPTVSNIIRQSPTTQSTMATSVVYRAVFSEPVSGVDATDFSLTVVSGSVSASVTSVTAVGTANTTYDVSVSSISGSGELRLDLNATGTGIVDAVGNSISGGYMGGETYIIQLVDQTPPTVSSIIRQSPISSTTNATSVTFKVTFSESVNGVDATDFIATVVSGTLSATVASVTAVSNSIYSVTVNSISGNGLLRLDLNASGTGITDLAGNAISGGFTAGQTYTIDQTPPAVSNIIRQSPTTQSTTATSVVYRAVFSEPVSGVDAIDFSLTVVSGSVSASVTSVTAVGTANTTYDVSVSSVSGSGELRLDLNATGTGIVDAVGNSISGGYMGGETYIIQLVDQTPPTVSSIIRQSPTSSTTNATSVTFKVTFSESVNGVDATDFTATVVSGTLSATVASVTAVNSSIYSVTVNSISGNGVLRLDLNASGTGISDLAGNAISDGYTGGETYIIDQTSLSTGFASVTYLTSVPISSHTGYEQQAKVWTYAGYWWAVMATANGTKIFRLDGTNWTDILTIAASTNSKADCKVVENVTHILLFRGASSNSYLVSVEYDASTNTYKLWSKRSSKITIVFESNTQTATLDMDGTGGMWVASDALNDINVRWSDYPYSTWSAPIAIASGVTDDDQSAIVALKNAGKIGVLWSNQNTKRWGFKTHTDGTAPATWSADEVPASQSALDLNHGFADDHMNIVPASDGTLYCAIKTGYDTPGYPKIALLVRRPSGTWDDVYPVTTYPVGTRPIIMLNEAKNKLKIIYSSQEGGGDILYKEALLSDLTTFSQEFTLFTGNYNFLTSTHQTYDPKIAVLITDQNSTSIKAAGFLGSDDPSSSITMTSPAAIRVPSEDVPVDPIDDLQANLIAYPNPFSTNAIITFTLPYADAYTVALYNINGVKVSVLKQGRAEAGKLNIVNIDGSRLSNGLYFVKVQAGAKSKTLKLALQK